MYMQGSVPCAAFTVLVVVDARLQRPGCQQPSWSAVATTLAPYLRAAALKSIQPENVLPEANCASSRPLVFQIAARSAAVFSRCHPLCESYLDLCPLGQLSSCWRQVLLNASHGWSGLWLIQLFLSPALQAGCVADDVGLLDVRIRHTVYMYIHMPLLLLSVESVGGRLTQVSLVLCPGYTHCFEALASLKWV